jgi:hypothetical protein
VLQHCLRLVFAAQAIYKWNDYLDMLSGYCAGCSLRQLPHEGF